MIQGNFSILVDYEATGKEPQTARPIEVGLALVDNELQVVKTFSQPIWEEGYPELSKEVRDITGIDPGMLRLEGIPLRAALARFGDEISEYLPFVQHFVAYNREYDETLTKAEALRQPLGLTKLGNLMLQLPWVCAMKDIEQNYSKKCWTQSHLALDYGIPVDPKQLHTALGDVLLMREILVATGAETSDMLEFQREPWVILQAQIPTPWSDGGKGRDLAKKQGFSWEKAKGVETTIPKAWVKAVKQRHLDKEIEQSPFKVTIIKEGQNGL